MSGKANTGLEVDTFLGLIFRVSIAVIALAPRPAALASTRPTLVLHCEWRPGEPLEAEAERLGAPKGSLSLLGSGRRAEAGSGDYMPGMHVS